MSDLAARVVEGCPASAGRVIRWLEDGDPRGVEAVKALYPHAGRAHVVGITGPPGAGKSTLVDAIVAALRARGRTVGVIAVDPSSPFSGGAILGDRVRMQRHATDEGVFIRSMATRGQLGGLARATVEACVVLEAFGRDVVLVETVGVGQDELDVAALAHTTIVVNVPGLGDEIQALKAGILEVGQIFVLNKADRPGADETEKQLRLMLHMRGGSADAWSPPLLRTVAAREEGIEAVVDACDAHREALRRSGADSAAVGALRTRLFHELLRASATRRLLDLAQHDEALARTEERVRTLEIDPHTAAAHLLDALLPEGPAS